MRAMCVWFMAAVAGAAEADVALGASDFPSEWRDGLIQLYAATGGMDWKNATGWGVDDTYPCDWYGVACARPHTGSVTVTELNLGFNGVTGSIPDNFFTLIGASLTKVDFGGNALEGPFPTSLSVENQPNLEYVLLDQPPAAATSFTGDCSKLWTITTLKHVNLRQNTALMGTFDLWDLRQLESLDVARTHLTGSVPEGLWTQENLAHLDLELVGLQGSIGSGVKVMSKMSYLNVGGNLLNGPIPEFHPSAFTQENSNVHIQNNQFTNLPNSFFTSEVKVVEATKNRIGGKLPATLARAAKLQFLYVGGNSLQGDLPDGLCQLNELITLDLSLNQFTSLPACLALPKLQQLELFNNALSGPVPLASLCSMTALKELQLQNNKQLTGNLTSCVAGWKDMETLVIELTSMGGVIPDELFSLSKLKTLILSESRFEGEIPDKFDTLPDLQSVTLGSRHIGTRILKPCFEGPFPESLLKGPQNLTSVSMQFNKLNGPLPDSFDADRLGYLKQLLINNNELDGEVPPSLIALMGAGRATERIFALEFNHFTGGLPDLSAVTNAAKITIHNNHFSGYPDPAVFNQTNPYPAWLDPSTADGKARRRMFFSGMRLLPPCQTWVKQMGGHGQYVEIDGTTVEVSGKAGYPIINRAEAETVTIRASVTCDPPSNLPKGDTHGLVALLHGSTANGSTVSDLVPLDHPVPVNASAPNVVQDVNFTIPEALRSHTTLGHISFSLAFHGILFTELHDTNVTTVTVSQVGKTVAAVLYDPHPTIKYVTPQSVRKQGCGTITVVGANFADTGEEYLKCKFDAVDQQTGAPIITDATYVNATAIICHIPQVGDDHPMALGAYELSVSPNNWTTASDVKQGMFTVVDQCPLSRGIHALPRGVGCPCDYCPCGSAGKCVHHTALDVTLSQSQSPSMVADWEKDGEDLTCSCDEGFQGATCEVCTKGRWGASCTPCMGCNEPHGTCDESKTGTGACSCEMWYGGKQCGFYYKYCVIVGVPVLLVTVALTVLYYWWRGRAPKSPRLNRTVAGRSYQPVA
eukprot:TRINITY_DN16311_c0_g1_i1.p1 TRINITY_DN16311_c0_g1~~TRINITY_DN16311_c0_g1_i1.p1  ORF type:complete len:1038 (+),score=276.41 TRINITY_DN16311_c0_g1_i1:51-3164(+)